MEEGTYTEAEHGITAQASSLTTNTMVKKGTYGNANTVNLAGAGSSYSGTYSSPIVFGQIASASDPLDADHFQVFYTAGSRRTNPPSSTRLRVGRSSCEASRSFSSETVHYIILEAGTYTLPDGSVIDTGLSSDNVKGSNSATYQYNMPVSLPTQPTFALVSLAGLDGADGGWATLTGSDPLSGSAGTIAVRIDEDQLLDTERAHTAEQISYFVM